MPVRHVIFIEEAHNIIAPSTQQAGADSVDPKISATAYIVKMLAEVRALREAIVIADQLPTALASEVTKNTGWKLVHRLTAQDDREQIGTAISASPVQLERMASFTSGRAFIYHERTQKPFEMQVAEWIKPNVTFDVSNDTQLYAQLWLNPDRMQVVANAWYNWEEKYLFSLNDAIDGLCNRYLRASDYTEVLCCIAQRDVMLAECDALHKKCLRMKELWLLKENSTHPLQNAITEDIAFIEGMIAQLKMICKFDEKGKN